MVAQREGDTAIRQAGTDSDGRYVSAGLRRGTYALTVSSAEFETFRRNSCAIRTCVRVISLRRSGPGSSAMSLAERVRYAGRRARVLTPLRTPHSKQKSRAPWGRTPGEESPLVCSEVQTKGVEETLYANKPPWPRQAISQPVT